MQSKFTKILLSIILVIAFVAGLCGCEMAEEIFTVLEQMPTAPYEATEPPAPELPDYAWEVRYWGQKLPEEEQKIYQHIVDHVIQHKSEVSPFRLTDIDRLDHITEMIYNDYPEIFWYNGGYQSTYYEYDSFVDVEMTPQYKWDAQTCQGYQAEIEAKTADILLQLEGCSDYEKVKGVYEYLVDYTAYDLAYLGTTMYELFHDGKAVCEGYTRAAQYLLLQLDVEVIYVDGEGGNDGEWELHAWNIVKVDGAYYQLDVTWGDPYYEDGTQVLNYDYLCVTTEEMKQGHSTDWEALPDCTDTAANYYVRENRILDTYDEKIIKQWMEEDSQQRCLAFKVADGEVYETVKQNLDAGEFGEMLYDSLGFVGQYTYEISDQMWTIRLRW